MEAPLRKQSIKKVKSFFEDQVRRYQNIKWWYFRLNQFNSTHNVIFIYVVQERGEVLYMLGFTYIFIYLSLHQTVGGLCWMIAYVIVSTSPTLVACVISERCVYLEQFVYFEKREECMPRMNSWKKQEINWNLMACELCLTWCFIGCKLLYKDSDWFISGFFKNFRFKKKYQMLTF